MTIELTPQLECALASEAARRGTTPQSLAVELIESQLPRLESAVEQLPAKSLLDRWREHLEAIEADKTPRTGPTNLSQDIGRRFTELLQEQRQQGRL